ncbi:hypothetical protein J6590_086083 [Homalodisca vitripennis]|nr:hypothetical protein J6590_086083 [Homalodisca vitripennis]
MVEVSVNKRALREIRKLGITEEATSAEYKITSRMTRIGTGIDEHHTLFRLNSATKV